MEETASWNRFDRADAGPRARRHHAGGSVPLPRQGQPEASEADILGALDRALGCIIEATRAHEGGLMVTDKSGCELILALVRGHGCRNRLLWRRTPLAQDSAHRPVRPSLASEGGGATEVEVIHGAMDVAAGPGKGCHIAARLFDGNDVLGVIELFNKKSGDRFSRGDHNNLTVLANLVSPIVMHLRDHRAESPAGN